MKWIASAALATLALGAQAQTYYNGNPNILVPKSSIPHAGSPSTHYLIWVGPSASLPNGGVFRGPSAEFAGPAGYHPADIQAAYGMPPNGGTGAIAIVDFADEGNPLGDFNTFSATFGLPQETSTNPTASSNKVFQVVYAEGTKPPYDGGWSGEESLDMEWAHAMAPKAKIYLVESGGDLIAANQVAAKLVGVREVSNSWGYPGEGLGGAGELQADPSFIYPGVVFLASSGDAGGVTNYPATSPNVVGVGGTSLFMNGSTVTGEIVWGGTGGGPSLYEPRPSYQSSVQGIVGPARGSPDIAAVADPGTGVAVYNSSIGGWVVFGGTSVACPVCAGITNTRGHFSTGSAAELARTYSLKGTGLYRDITQGGAGSFSALAGYDLCTGIGCPVGLYAIQVTNPINASGVQVLTGTYLSGLVTSLFNVDGNTYNVGSTFAPSVGQATTVLVNFNLGKSSSNWSNMLISLTELAPSGSTIQVFAYNWTARTYDVVQAFAGLPTGPSYTGTMNNLAPYENGANTIQLAVRTFIPQRVGNAVFA